MFFFSLGSQKSHLANDITGLSERVVNPIVSKSKVQIICGTISLKR